MSTKSKKKKNKQAKKKVDLLNLFWLILNMWISFKKLGE